MRHKEKGTQTTASLTCQPGQTRRGIRNKQKKRGKTYDRQVDRGATARVRQSADIQPIMRREPGERQDSDRQRYNKRSKNKNNL